MPPAGLATRGAHHITELKYRFSFLQNVRIVVIRGKGCVMQASKPLWYWIVLLAFFPTMFAVMHFRRTSTQTSAAPTAVAQAPAVILGTVGTLRPHDARLARTWVIAQKSDYDEAVKLGMAGDTEGFAEILERKGFPVPVDARVKIVEHSWGVIRVRVLDGLHSGRYAWTEASGFIPEAPSAHAQSPVAPPDALRP